MAEHEQLDRIPYEQDGAVARIVLGAPEGAGTQTARQGQDLERCLRWAETDDDVRVLVLQASGA